MDKELEHARLILISVISPIVAYLAPTKGSIIALIIVFGFNIWCGMRADGVSINRCKNFSMSKFKDALLELVLYITIIYVIYTAMKSSGDDKEGMYAVKALGYIFMYVYLVNGFKNLIKAYPKKIALRIIYSIIRLEFNRVMPSYWRPIMQRYGMVDKDDIINENNKKSIFYEPDTDIKNLSNNE